MYDTDYACQMALGELAMMKVAGEVDDYDFDDIAYGIIKEAKDAEKIPDNYFESGADDKRNKYERAGWHHDKDEKWYKKLGHGLANWYTAADIRDLRRQRKFKLTGADGKALEGDARKAMLEDLKKKGLGRWGYLKKAWKPAVAYGAPIGTAVAAKMLYDHNK